MRGYHTILDYAILMLHAYFVSFVDLFEKE